MNKKSLHILSVIWIFAFALLPLPSSQAAIVFNHVVVDNGGPSNIWLKTVGDINNDGQIDLVAGGNGSGSLVWYQSPNWTKQTIASEDSFSTDGEVADVDRDGDQDVIMLTMEDIRWYENPNWTVHVIEARLLHDVEVSDLDGDGDVDLVGRNQGISGNELHLYRQDSPSAWMHQAVSCADGEGLKLVDVDRDGDGDVVINGSWFENTKNVIGGTWTAYTYTSSWTYPNTFVSAGDINGDGRVDLVLAPSESEGGTYRISWFEAPVDPRDADWTENIVDDNVETVHHFVGVADMDNDGDQDIASAEMQQGSNPDEVKVYLNADGVGDTWTKQVLATTGSHSMRIVDVDNDGDYDLYGANWQGNQVELWVNQTKNPTLINFSIGGVDHGSYYTQNSSLQRSFAATLGGPVKVVSPNGVPFVTSQRVVFGNSFNELMGYPVDQFTTEYWFPWYDMVYMNTWVLVGNPSSTQTAYADIYIGGVKKNNTPGGVPYAIPPGDRVLPQFPGVLDGPVRVVSVTGTGTPTAVPIFASERSTYLSSFNEVMGYPANQFTTEYWFPWYDQVYMNSWVLVGNPSSTQTAYVDIYIAGVKRNTTPGGIPYAIPPNGRVLPQFPGVLDGPVRVVSVTGLGTPTPLPIFASERSTYQGSFNEVMGYPADQFTTEYWYPWFQHNSGGMTSWLLVGNPSTAQTAYVDIYIGGIKRGSYSIPSSDSIIPQFNLSQGPVRVVSVTGAGTPTAIPVFTSERSLYGSSFNEVMGYPADQLSSEYWFTWYDSVYMATDLVVGVP